MLAGLITVAVTGSIEVGGLKKVWEINQNYGRINFFEYVIDRAVILIYSCYKALHIQRSGGLHPGPWRRHCRCPVPNDCDSSKGRFAGKRNVAAKHRVVVSCLVTRSWRRPLGATRLANRIKLS